MSDDPRIQPLTEVIGPWFHFEPFSVEDLAEQVIAAADAADRRAGYVRVRVANFAKGGAS